MKVSRTALTFDQKRTVQVHVRRTIPNSRLGKASSASACLTPEPRGSDPHLPVRTSVPRRIGRNCEGSSSTLENAFLAFYQLNEGNAILTDDLRLEEAWSIRAAQGICEGDIEWMAPQVQGAPQHQAVHLHGEPAFVDRGELAVNRMTLKKRIDQFPPENVFNFDETALFYRLPPNKTLATASWN